jgi:hypothetical protein
MTQRLGHRAFLRWLVTTGPEDNPGAGFVSGYEDHAFRIYPKKRRMVQGRGRGKKATGVIYKIF